MTMNEIIQTLLDVMGKKRLILPIPLALAKLGTAPLVLLPSPPMTPHGIDFAVQDGLVDTAELEKILDVHPIPLQRGAGEVLRRMTNNEQPPPVSERMNIPLKVVAVLISYVIYRALLGDDDRIAALSWWRSASRCSPTPWSIDGPSGVGSVRASCRSEPRSWGSPCWAWAQYSSSPTNLNRCSIPSASA